MLANRWDRPISIGDRTSRFKTGYPPTFGQNDSIHAGFLRTRYQIASVKVEVRPQLGLWWLVSGVDRRLYYMGFENAGWGTAIKLGATKAIAK